MNNKIFHKGSFYELSDLNIKSGSVVIDDDLYLFNPGSLTIAELTYERHIDWSQVQPIIIVSIKKMRFHCENLRPLCTGSHDLG